MTGKIPGIPARKEAKRKTTLADEVKALRDRAKREEAEALARAGSLDAALLKARAEAATAGRIGEGLNGLLGG